jgi:hypothetical protein
VETDSNTPIAFSMKANKSLVTGVIAFSILASNAFAQIKSPYPRQASPPDNSIVIADDRHELVQTTLRASR